MSPSCKPHPSFRLKKTCDECPWRRDVPVGRFPPERYERLRNTIQQNFGPIFACHKTSEEGPVACAGYLMRDGENNFTVRLALIRRVYDPRALEAAGPLYDDFEEMAEANGARSR